MKYILKNPGTVLLLVLIASCLICGPNATGHYIHTVALGVGAFIRAVVRG